MKLLTGWENLAAGGRLGRTGPGGAGACFPVSCRKRSEGCDDLRSQAGSCPLLWRWICSLAVGAAGQQSPSSPTLQPPGSTARAQRRDGEQGTRQLPPRAAHFGAQGGPNPCTPCASGCKAQGLWGYPHWLRVTARAHPSSRGLQSHRQTRCRGGSQVVPALGPFPTPGWAWKGCSAPGAAVLWRRKWQGGEGKGGEGRPGSSSRAGDIWELGVNR